MIKQRKTTLRKDYERSRYLALDTLSVRERDDNGFLHVAISPLSKVQVAPYWGYEIPHYRELGLDSRKTYYGYRSPEELSRPETVKSINGIPIQFGHHEEYADAPKNRTRVGQTGTDGKFTPPYLTNSLHIIDRVAQDAIQDGTARELSLAYAYDPDFTSGVTANGQKYDFVMRNIKANHVALVEKGRAGPTVFVADSQKKENPNMEGNDEKLAAVEERLAEEVVPALKEAIAELQQVAPKAPAPSALGGETADATPPAPESEPVPTPEETEETKEITETKSVTPPPAPPAETTETQSETLTKTDETVEDDSTPPKGEQESIAETKTAPAPAKAEPDKFVTEALAKSGYAEKSETERQAFADGLAFAASLDTAPAPTAEPKQPALTGDATDTPAPAQAESKIPPRSRSRFSRFARERSETKGATPLAADEAQKIRAEARSEVIAELRALEEVQPVLGKLKVGAFDSANGIYIEALKKLGINNIDGADARSCYLSYVAGQQSVKQSITKHLAQDAKPASDSDGLSIFLKNVKD